MFRCGQPFFKIPTGGTNMAKAYVPKGPVGRFVHELEETFIALILGAMTIITFINVVLRYGFNTGLIWGLEMVTFLFAWLVLFGVSYAFKTTANLGVDAITNLFSPSIRRALALFAGVICIAYGFLLLKGAWDTGPISRTCRRRRGAGSPRGSKR